MARGLPEVVPPGYFERFPARVRERLDRPQGRRLPTLPTWTWAAAAALLLAVLTPLTLRGPQPATRPPATLGGPAAAPPAEPPAMDTDRLRALGYAGGSGSAEGKKEKTRTPESERLRARDQKPDAGGFAPRPQDDVAVRRGGEPPAAPPPPPAGVMPQPVPAPREEAAAPRAAEADDRAPAANAPERLVEPTPRKDAVGRVGPTLRDAHEKQERETAVGASSAPARPSAKELRYQALFARRASSVAEARTLREAWRVFAQDYPDGPEVDEARVRVIELGVQAYQLGGGETDLALCREDARAYLGRDDARQKDRVRARTAPLGR
jgi:hypothetical protein